MIKSLVTLSSILLVTSTAQAATIVDFAGNTNGGLATGTATISLAADGGSISGTLTNTSPFDARITGFGFNIGPRNLDGFSGSPANITDPGDVDFDFADGNVGNVPQFNRAELDFAYITGEGFSGGSPHQGLKPFNTLEFMVTGPFGALQLDEASIAEALFVRFQRVGQNGNASDVAAASLVIDAGPGPGPGPGPGQGPVIPEPASMVLLGSGLTYLAARRRRQANS